MTLKLKKNVAISESGFVFDPATGDSFSVNRIGAKIMEMLQKGLSNEEVINHLSEIFNAEKRQIQEDLDDFIHHLKQLRMIDETEA